MAYTIAMLTGPIDILRHVSLDPHRSGVPTSHELGVLHTLIMIKNIWLKFYSAVKQCRRDLPSSTHCKKYRWCMTTLKQADGDSGRAVQMTQDKSRRARIGSEKPGMKKLKTQFKLQALT